MPPSAIPPLNHAAVGNGRILALVAPSSAVDWLCLPRMDSGSVFGRLLDTRHGGTFRLLPGGTDADGALTYVPNTNVACTTFRDAAGHWDVYDFAPRIGVENGEVYTPPEFVRLVVPRSGTCRLVVDFDPRPDYGRCEVTARSAAFGIVIDGGPRPLHLLTNAPLEAILQRAPVEVTEPTYFVRIGNAAAEQRQNDLMGELVLCLASELDDPRLGDDRDESTFALITTLVEEAIRAAPQPDTGIREFRTEFRRHTFSRAMCWAAMQRGAHADDIGVPSSTFTICSFWWAEVLAMQGRMEEAVQLFERVLAHANPLGLFSEDIDRGSGALLGNFPQAYTHVGLINAALTIGQLREGREGRARGWN